MGEVMQRTDLWDKDRLGKFTASEIWKLMSDPKSKKEMFSETAYTYILDKVAEELTGFATVSNGEALVWGIEQEAKAKKWFTTITGKTIEEVGFIHYNEESGGSPDGKVEDGIIESKCPFNTTNHIWNMLCEDFRSDKDLKKHYWQMQMNMLVTGKDRCYFISFDPRIDAESGMFIKVIERNQVDIDLMIARISEAIEAKKMILNKLQDGK